MCGCVCVWSEGTSVCVCVELRESGVCGVRESVCVCVCVWSEGVCVE